MFNGNGCYGLWAMGRVDNVVASFGWDGWLYVRGIVNQGNLFRGM